MTIQMPKQRRWRPAWLKTGVCAIVGFGVAACESEPELIAYRLATVSIRDVVVSANADGLVEPIRTIEVKSKASGEIFRMPVEVGDVVGAGDLLVQVDPRIPIAAVRQAEADLDRARTQLDISNAQMDRAENLHKSAAITEQEYESAQLAVAQARASLVRAERTVEDSRIAAEDTDVRAPINGVIMTKRVEQGTVITSATSRESSGSVLLQMANLDTVQVRALVAETDIGKIRAGLGVTVTVQAYAERPFRGTVLKIEPQSVERQNVTMFPVLMRIPNTDGLLRPGMNAKVEIHVSQQQNVLTVPNTALRTDRDYLSVAALLGFEEETFRQRLADERAGREPASGDPSEGQPSSERRTVSFRGREIEVPPDVDISQARAVVARLENGGGFQSLSPEDRQLVRQLNLGRGGAGQGMGGQRRGGQPGEGAGERRVGAGFGERGGGQRPGGQVAGAFAGQRAGRQPAADDSFLFGGNYVVYVMRDGAPTPVPVTTGLTDMHYSQVVSGLSDGDTVLVLPSASLLSSQREWQERIQRRTGGGLPGVTRR